MTTNFQRGSAKIYEFPARGRFVQSSHEDTSSAAIATSPRAVKVAKIVCGGAWYHEEAIQDADRGRAST